MVIVPVDGTSIAHTDLRGDDGVGPIGTRAAGAVGLKAMTAIALTYDGVPLGVAAHSFWARPMERLTVPREKRSLEERESRHWTGCRRTSTAPCTPSASCANRSSPP